MPFDCPSALRRRGLRKDVYKRQALHHTEWCLHRRPDCDGLYGDWLHFIRMQRSISVSYTHLLTACQVLDRRMKSEKNIDREGELTKFVLELAQK